MGADSLRPALQRVALAPRLAHVSELMQPLAEAGAVPITTTGDATAVADPDFIDQVLVGLVGNALKHTPPGGSVHLAAADGRRDAACHRRRHRARHPRARAASGLRSLLAGRWSSSAGGFGLGLGICREYVEAMGGTISIASQLGAGTTVEILLPRQRAEQALEVHA